LMADLIATVGIGGNFLSQRSTLAQLKAGEHFLPRFSHRGSYDAWLRRGKDEIAAARDEVRRCLAAAPGPALPSDTERSLREIVRRADPAAEPGLRASGFLLREG